MFAIFLGDEFDSTIVVGLVTIVGVGLCEYMSNS